MNRRLPWPATGSVGCLFLLLAPACASSSSAGLLVFPAGADRWLTEPTEVVADSISVRVPRLYRGIAVAVYDRRDHRVVDRPDRIHLEALASGVAPLVLQIGELRLVARRALHADFEDEGPRRDRLVLKLLASGGVSFTGGGTRAGGERLVVSNARIVELSGGVER
ncbi:MAG: hypothetical protein AB1486_29225 [Planctomycetota bacterium]